MASMKDIANACHVSVATVSKALNDHKDIGEETKLHIKQVAKEMGYFPNSVARALKTNKTYNIGVLFVEEARSGLTHNFFSHVLDSFKTTAEEQGYDITFLNCSKKRYNRMSYLEHSRYRGFDGVVIACVNFDDPQVVELIQSDLPIVTVDRTYDNRIGIISDNYQGQKELLEYIIGMGHRKIAYVHGLDSAVTRQRIKSFRETMQKHDIAITDEYMKVAEYRDPVMTAVRTEELLRLSDPPTCILFPDDYAAYGGINVIKAAGLRIPEDISVAGYDGITLAKMIEPKLTTIEQDTKTLGMLAAKKLISLIEKPKETDIEIIMVEGHLLKGETVAKCQ